MYAFFGALQNLHDEFIIMTEPDMVGTAFRKERCAILAARAMAQKDTIILVKWVQLYGIVQSNIQSNHKL